MIAAWQLLLSLSISLILIVPYSGANAGCVPVANSTPSPLPGTVVTCTGLALNQNGTNGYGTGNQTAITINVLNSANVTGNETGINVGDATINNSGSIFGLGVTRWEE